MTKILPKARAAPPVGTKSIAFDFSERISAPNWSTIAARRPLGRHDHDDD
jgi:hypothetical protein